MNSKTTKYKIATTHDEYVDCHGLLEKDDKLEYPTVMAVRDGKAVGMISTTRGKENMFAGHIKADNKYTAMRLYELYEQTLSNLGVSHYLFGIERENTKLINTIEKLFEIEPFMKTDKLLFYVRRL